MSLELFGCTYALDCAQLLLAGWAVVAAFVHRWSHGAR